MAPTRRTFIKLAGAAGIAAATGVPAKTVAAHAGSLGASSPRDLPRGMTFCTLRRDDGEYVLGVRTRRGVLDVQLASRLLGMRAPKTIDDLIQGGDWRAVEAVVQQALTSSRAARAFVDEATARFGPAVTNPEKIICVGFNYKAHADESGVPYPPSPILFNKFNNSLNHHEGVIKLPQHVSFQFDYEVELVVVMGKDAFNVGVSEALSYVFGYATGNDFSARDLQRASTQFMLGKTCDGFAPLGPWLVTADQVDPQDLTLQTWVNGELRQNSHTSLMIFNCATLVSYTSRHMTLKPGDIIYSGTPSGVINGLPPEQRVWLKPGDEVITQVGDLGALRVTLAPGP
ncbi:MAG TPA: fumarylacetoacetate hydrolase family protein [Myxococcaceae bacterium]|nr:fumarylacetoacetate hydrolase family protein [Myxococcaceae bacterium]